MKLSEIKQQFLELYGGPDEGLRVFYSPGRVNLIGEHTDYTGGFVFPAALTLGTTIVARKREDGRIQLAATDLDARVSAEIARLDDYRELAWGNYQLGVAQMLKEEGFDICGADLLYHDSVPHGAGLSSSAAIEVATAVMFMTFSNEKNGVDEPVDGKLAAIVSQRAENRYIGVNCGIMDQFASAMGKRDHAIFLNCQDLSFAHVPLHLGDYCIVVANTNKKRSLADSAYNERRKACEDGFAVLQPHLSGAACLGDIAPDAFEGVRDLIGDPVVKNRVTHVISENARVKQSVRALEEGRLEEFGRLMVQSHESLRDLYEVSCFELDVLVEEALKVSGCLGSRMTGAGFGGCTVSIVRKDRVAAFEEAVGSNYAQRTDYEADFYVSDIGDGGREIGWDE